MKYEIENFSSANAKRLKDALKRIVEYDRANKVPASTLKADENLFNKVSENLKKVTESKED